MKWSIKHLPKRTQEELNVLMELIVHNVPWYNMIVLYGSYARGGYVLWDQKVEFGVNTAYQSDYDLMIIVPKSKMKYTEDRLGSKVTPKYHKIFARRRHASPQFIIEDISKLNKELERSQYFFTDIVKKGIKIYETKEFQLAKPRELSFKEIKKTAQFEYNIHFPNGETFLDIAYSMLEKGKYKIGSFELLQACRRFYSAISLVFTNYCLKSHKLKKLGVRIKEYSRELITVLPTDTDFEKRCF